MSVAGSEKREAQCCSLQRRGPQALVMLRYDGPDFAHGYNQAHAYECDGLGHRAVTVQAAEVWMAQLPLNLGRG